MKILNVNGMNGNAFWKFKKKMKEKNKAVCLEWGWSKKRFELEKNI